MPLRRLLVSMLLGCSLAATLVADEELKLRPLKPIVTRLSEHPDPEISELGYVAARGAALFTALSSYIDTNAAGERDKKMAQELQKRAVPYYQVALACGLMTRKSSEKAKEQVALLLKTYSEMIVRSKQLNNEVLSAAIIADMEALKPIEGLVVGFAETIEKEASEKKKS